MYAARLEDDKVTQVIVGDVEWAESRLGGTWISSQTKVGIGWELYDGGVRPPSPFPSWTWDGSAWQAPVPQPDGVYTWDEDAQAWAEAGEDL